MYIAEYEYRQVQLDVPVPEYGMKAITEHMKETFGFFENWEDALEYLQRFYKAEDNRYYSRIECSTDSITITENKNSPNYGQVRKIHTEIISEEEQYMITEHLTVRDIRNRKDSDPFEDIMDAYNG